MTSPSDDEVTRRARRLAQGRSAPKAGRALGELGAQALGPLREALAHANPFVRSGALVGLEAAVGAGVAADAVAGDVAGALAKDADARVRETACAVLGRLGAAAVDRARDALARAAEDADPRVRAAAATALGAG